ncbi:MAG: phage head closure protein [Rickettsiales bacterium]
MKNIKLAELNHLVKIQQSTSVADGFGGLITLWHDYEAVWAKIIPLSLTKNILQGIKGHTITHSLIIRLRDDLDANMRIVMGDTILEIDRLHSILESKYLQIDTIRRGKCC